ncbi:MAG: aminotransferase class I/II-fold pyridoxal phosphate-dependent enzyme [Clostridia bacterium]|nr:MAG: aminotransferase class I/II-fold pyridoxal phosphate-dependent enzyme [Clostridia bacterium]
MRVGPISEAPLVTAVFRHVGQGYHRWHVPAHKGRQIWPPGYRFLGSRVWAADLTELPGLDDLHTPHGVIAQAQDLAARALGAGKSFFLVNGASVGLQAALLACCQPGDRVILPRTAHQSVLAGVILAGAEPVYLSEAWQDDLGIPLGLAPDTLRQVLACEPPARVLLVLHPSFYGVVSPLAPLAAMAHRRGLVVVADEAHGTHFAFHPELPASALASGADIAIHGFHKSGGALTQAAVLSVRQGFDPSRVEAALDCLQTTSPSYLLLASIDAARCALASQGRARLERALEAAAWARKQLRQWPEFVILDEGMVGREAALDPLKMVLAAPGLGLSGRALAAALRRRGRIQVETYGWRHVVLVWSLADDMAQARHLVRVLHDLAGDYRAGRPRAPRAFPGPPPRPQVVMSPREAFFASRRTLPLGQARGQVAAGFVVPYPPGFPVLAPGELITGEIIAYLAETRTLVPGLHGNLEKLPVVS